MAWRGAAGLPEEVGGVSGHFCVLSSCLRLGWRGLAPVLAFVSHAAREAAHGPFPRFLWLSVTSVMVGPVFGCVGRHGVLGSWRSRPARGRFSRGAAGAPCALVGGVALGPWVRQGCGRVLARLLAPLPAWPVRAPVAWCLELPARGCRCRLRQCFACAFGVVVSIERLVVGACCWARWGRCAGGLVLRAARLCGCFPWPFGMGCRCWLLGCSFLASPFCAWCVFGRFSPCMVGFGGGGRSGVVCCWRALCLVCFLVWYSFGVLFVVP